MNPEQLKPTAPLEAKEGVVLDAEGNTLFTPEGTEHPGPWNSSAQLRVFKGGWGLALLLGIGIPVFLVAGFVIFAAIAALMIVLWLLRTLFFPTSNRK